MLLYRAASILGRLPVIYTDSTTSSEVLLVNRLIQGHIYLAQCHNCLTDVLKALNWSNIEESLVKRLFLNTLSIIGTSSTSSSQLLSGDDISACSLPPLHKLTGELLLKLGLELSGGVSRE